jgi:hypothetical protein
LNKSQNPDTARSRLDPDVIMARFRTAVRTGTLTALCVALADIPFLLAEVRRLASLLSQMRMRLANLRAAARATLAAHRDGENDPFYYLRDELDHDDAEHRGQR